MVALLERYSPEHELGHGSQATVFLAKSKKTGEEVAVRTIDKAGLNPDEAIKVYEEVRIMKDLSHRYLLKMLEWFEDDSYIYVVTELCEGGELFEQIVEREVYTERDAQRVLKMIAEALFYCHSNNIVHRDLKPENIFLTSRNGIEEIKLGDFGYAKQVERCLTDTSVGTPAYCAPEIFRKEKYGFAVDMWSFGVIAYVLLSGSLPFYSENMVVLQKKILELDFAFDEHTWGRVSEGARRLVSSCLRLDPTERLTAAQVLEHPWILNSELSTMDITPALDELRRFVLKRAFKRTGNAVRGVNKMKQMIAQMHLGEPPAKN